MAFNFDEYGNPVCQPLDTLEEVLQWEVPEFRCQTWNQSTEPDEPNCSAWQPKKHYRPQVIVCHDMAGGYLSDRFVQGNDDKGAYRLYHWNLVDTFIYFSHHLVTVPPIGWITAAHNNGVQVLGTIITEWEDGGALCKKLLESKDTLNHFITKLVHIAQYYQFDGWLINIENKIDADQIPQLLYFVNQLTIECHKSLKNATVLWYDSVTTTGSLSWQNELNSSNKAFFDVCDGVFLNYALTKEGLESSKNLAAISGRQFDVYAGVDVFGRSIGCKGFECHKAIQMIKECGLSYALFAPGWVHECLGAENFEANEAKFWGLLSGLVHSRPVSMPLATSFCQGCGQKLFLEGQVASDKPWFNLSMQQVQPSYTCSQFQDYSSSCAEESDLQPKQHMSLCHTDAYQGGGCLHLSTLLTGTYAPVFKLFDLRCDTKKTLHVTATWKSPESKCSLALILTMQRDSESHSKKTIVMSRELSEEEKKETERSLAFATHSSNSHATAQFRTFDEKEIGTSTSWKRSSAEIDPAVLCEGENYESTTVFLLSCLLIPERRQTENQAETFRLSLLLGHLHITNSGCSSTPTVSQFNAKRALCGEIMSSTIKPSKEMLQKAYSSTILDRKCEKVFVACGEEPNQSSNLKEHHELHVEKHTLDDTVDTKHNFSLFFIRWDADNIDNQIDFFIIFTRRTASEEEKFVGCSKESCFVYKCEETEAKTVSGFTIKAVMRCCKTMFNKVSFIPS